jgi:cytoskeletal protein CcmA (bactofilin family)
MMSFAPLALTAATGAMFALPLAPALRELRSRRDASPIPTRQDDGKITNFADSFRRYIEPLLPELRECVGNDEVREITLPNGRRAVIVGCSGTHQLSARMHGARIDSLVLCGQRIVLGDGMVFTDDLYAADQLFCGENSVLRAVLGEADVFLAEGSRVMRWLHANQSVYVSRGSTVHGRVSAGHAVYLWPGCSFERVHAPRVACVWGESGFPIARTTVVSNCSRLDTPIRRWRVTGDFQLQPGEDLVGNIVGTGEIRISKDCCLHGAIKSHGDTIVDADAEVDGSIVSIADVNIRGECFVRGPVLAEGEITIGAGAQIGAPNMLTTVSARSIRIEPGALIHGTVWARESGRTEL